MAVTANDLATLSRQLADAVAKVMNGVTADASLEERKKRLEARKKLQASRQRVLQLQSEAAARELNGLASQVSQAAFNAERKMMENVLASFREAAEDVVENVTDAVEDAIEEIREMLREVEEEPAEVGQPVDEPDPPVVPEPQAEDPVLMRRTTHGRRVWGHLVEQVQMALKANGFDPDGIDMDFGGKTAKALADWHQATQANVPTALTANEWSALTAKPLPDMFDLCAQVTAAFEGHGFSTAVGNFDGAIATWGYHGFTLKFSHLQKILERTEDADPGSLAKAFGEDKAKELRKMFRMSLTKQRTWGQQVLLEGGKLRPSWSTGFTLMGENPVCQAQQLAYSRAEFWERIALPQANRLKLTEALSLGLMFDHSIQQGGFSKSSLNFIESEIAKAPDMSEEAKRAIIAKRAHETLSSTNFRASVKSRRETFVDGTGRVNGATYDLSFWGMQAAFDEKETHFSTTVEPDEPPVSFDVAPDFATWFDENVKPHTPNFSAHEFLAMGASNQPGGSCAGRNRPPPRELWENCIELAKVLQEFRNRVGASVRVHSMYRSPEYNDCVGGKPGSQHKQFRAADISVRTGSPSKWRDILRKIRDDGVFKGGIGTYRTFVHVDTRGRNANWTG